MMASAGSDDAGGVTPAMTTTLDTLYFVFESNDDSTLLTKQKVAKIKVREKRRGPDKKEKLVRAHQFALPALTPLLFSHP